MGLKVLTGQGAEIHSTTVQGRQLSSIFAAMNVFDRELMRERRVAGLTAARARGRIGVRA